MSEIEERRRHNTMVTARIVGQPLGGRTLHIGNDAWPLTNRQVAALTALQLIYECGGEHDFHLMPDGRNDKGWELDQVEALVRALLGPVGFPAST